MTNSHNQTHSVSVVIVPLVGGETLKACVDSVACPEVELIVVSRTMLPEIKASNPEARVVVNQGPVPMRRQTGFLHATGDIVVLIEDTTVVTGDWLAGIEAAFDEPDIAAASGPVAVDSRLGKRFQALACTEYGRYHGSQVFGDGAERKDVTRLPGNFLCYRRRLAQTFVADADQGLVEADINNKLLASEYRLVMEPRLSNQYCGSDVWGAKLATRYHHGHIYAGNMSQGENITKRLIHAAKALLLPLVLSLRAISYLLRMKEIKNPVAVSMWVCLLESCWSMGELVGSLMGPPKNMDHWR